MRTTRNTDTICAKMHFHNVTECGEHNYHWTLMVS